MLSLLKRYRKFIIALIVLFVLVQVLSISKTREGRGIIYEYYFVIGFFMQGILITFRILLFNLKKLQDFVKKASRIKDIEWILTVSIAGIIFLGFDEILDNDFPKFNFLTALLWIFTIFQIALYFSNKNPLFKNPILEKNKNFIFYPLAFAFLTLGSFISDNRGLFPSDTQFKTVFWLLLLYLVFNWAFNQWKLIKQLKNEKVNSELLMLKSQVNPHFFFNTLNNLYGLTVEKSDEAPKVVLKISDMMRYTIYEGKKELVPLNEEIEYLNNYINLQKIRYHKNVEITFDHKIDEINYKIAPLLFIILLENSFKHGVDNLTSEAFVHIKLVVENNLLFFQIENNFDPLEITSKKGIGVKNLQRRLELIYPKKHHFITNIEDNIYKVELNMDLG